MKNKYIFTVTAGRSGQNTLTSIIENYAINCSVACEAPKIDYFFKKGFSSDLERMFRRRFIETHEMLGRGKVLTCFMDGNDHYIETVAKKRIDMIDKKLVDLNCSTYVDVSKFFARGLHVGFKNILPEFSLIHLVRDPVANMCSFLNRGKNFYLDNGYPSSKKNLLVLDEKNMKKSDLYLWAWCEMALRYEKIKSLDCVNSYVEIYTSKLNDHTYIDKCFNHIGLSHNKIQKNNLKLNTNIDCGYERTIVSKYDIEKFDRFLDMVPNFIIDKIPYLRSYNPRNVYKDVL